MTTHQPDSQLDSQRAQVSLLLRSEHKDTVQSFSASPHPGGHRAKTQPGFPLTSWPRII